MSFESEKEIDGLLNETQMKLNVRNTLGVKSAEDWIFNLNIGNVMLLSPLQFEDLYQSFLIENNSKRSAQELSKDMLLEKLVLLVVSYFCVGTEIRFLHQKVDTNKYPKKTSELWHSRALHAASKYLPKSCPLTQHVISSYHKHHLKPKVEERKRLEEEEA